MQQGYLRKRYEHKTESLTPLHGSKRIASHFNASVTYVLAVIGKNYIIKDVDPNCYLLKEASVQFNISTHMCSWRIAFSGSATLRHTGTTHLQHEKCLFPWAARCRMQPCRHFKGWQDRAAMIYRLVTHWQKLLLLGLMFPLLSLELFPDGN